MRKLFPIAALVMAIITIVDGGAHAAIKPEITVEKGRLRGIEEDGVLSFRGIPYAAPPVGIWRWQPPQAAEPWEGIRDATRYGHRCPQTLLSFRTPGPGEPLYFGDEDCLNLNVWVPKQRSDEPLPVMVFVHGGGFVSGSGVGAFYNDEMYSAEKLVKQGGVVVVTLNYRLGALGYLAEPSLSAASDSATSGNYGLMDQIAALQWVQDEISAFGGDPGNVTLWGESAGAMSICALIAQPLHRGLFHKVILQSGSCQVRTLVEQEKRGREFAGRLGCAAGEPEKQAKCLRAIPPRKLVEAQGRFSIYDYRQNPALILEHVPVVDGKLLPEKPFDLLREDGMNGVPLIMGLNQEEAPVFLFGGLITRRQYKDFLTKAGYSDEEVVTVMDLYPKEKYGSYARAAAALTRDLQFTCPSIAVRSVFKVSEEKVFAYLFDMPLHPWVERVARAFHTVELFYIFQKLRLRDIFNAVDEKAVLIAKAMGAYWTSFAARGEPLASGYPHWQPEREEKPTHLRFSETIRMEDGLQHQVCEKLATLSVSVH